MSPEEFQNYPIGLVVSTAMLSTIFVVGPILVQTFSKWEDKGIISCMIMLGCFCLWSFWCIVYLSQMHPLIGPRLKNYTLAWIGEKWGDVPT